MERKWELRHDPHPCVCLETSPISPQGVRVSAANLFLLKESDRLRVKKSVSSFFVLENTLPLTCNFKNKMGTK